MNYDEIKDFLNYNRNTGEFTWKCSISNNAKDGSRAGCLSSSGYVTIRFNKRLYYAHRLAWLFLNGYLPENNIDHINGKRFDNREKNLREVSQSCNSFNCIISKNNTSGVNGVSYIKSRDSWRAAIKINYNKIDLGSFKDKTEAVAHRLAAEQALNIDKCSTSSASIFIKNYIKEINYSKEI